MDDANKLNEESEIGRSDRPDVDPVARLNDWILEVDQKQKDLKTRSTTARKAGETGKHDLKHFRANSRLRAYMHLCARLQIKI